MPYLTDLIAPGMGPANYMTGTSADMEWFRREPKKENMREKKRVHVMALGDVGSTLLLGLKLLGGDCIHTIGIFDVRKEFEARFEFEMNQVTHPGAYGGLPPVEIVPEEQLFACDVFVFCASRGVPPVSETKMDVRMAQYEANAGLVELYAKKAVAAGFRGLFAVVSDPVDPLCLAAEAAGLNPARIKGYGLGVMNARAAYYAKKDARFASFLTEGAALPITMTHFPASLRISPFAPTLPCGKWASSRTLHRRFPPVLCRFSRPSGGSGITALRSSGASSLVRRTGSRKPASKWRIHFFHRNCMRE